jgi:hypothetical protein
MYASLLVFHSLLRWLVLGSLLFAIFRAFRGWYGNHPFKLLDDRARHITATIAHLQLILGIWLYSISPITAYFLENFKEAVHERNIRFFGMEHSIMMLLAITLLTIGSMQVKREAANQRKFKKMAICYTIALLMILSSVPWAFSSFVARPYFRTF